MDTPHRPITQQFRERAERDAFGGSHLTDALIDAISELEGNQRAIESRYLALRDELVREGIIEP